MGMDERKKYWRRRIGAGLVLAGLMAVPVGVSYHFNGIRLSPEAMDNAQLARNVARGRGLVTGVIRPASLLFHEDISAHPDLYRPPLPALILAAAFRVFGASDRVVSLWALLLFWVDGLLAVFLARRALGSGGAFLSAALYFTNASLLDSVLQGDPYLLASLVFLVLLFFLYRTDNAPVSSLAAGLLCGAGYLSSGGWFWFGAAALAGVYYFFRAAEGERFDLKRVSALIAGFLLPALFWWGRNLAAGGFLVSPLRSAEYRMFTSSFPGDSLLRETVREVFTRGVGMKTLILKWWQGGESVYESLLFFTGSFAVVFFWPALFLPFPDRKWSRLRYFIFGCLVLGVAQFVVFARQAGDIRFLVPTAIPLAAAAFLFILEKMDPPRRIPRRWLIGLLIGLSLVPAVDQLRISRSPQDPTRQNCLRLRDRIPAGEGVVADRPEAAAWYGDRPALWLPAEAGVPAGFRYLYLTPEAEDYPPVRRGNRAFSWPMVYRARGLSPYWEVEEYIPLPGDQFFCRIVPAP